MTFISGGVNDRTSNVERERQRQTCGRARARDDDDDDDDDDDLDDDDLVNRNSDDVRRFNVNVSTTSDNWWTT